MNARPLQVMLVDDDDAVRDSLAALLKTWRFDVGGYATGEAFLADADLSRADCVLLDVRLPDMSGLDVLKELRERNVDKPVIVITGHGDVAMAVKALQIGAQDFLEKPFDGDELAKRIQEMASAHRRQEDEAAARLAPFDCLTPRETEVMLAVVEGRANKVIAQDLSLSTKTVELHRKRVMEKTGACSISELVRMAVLAGLLDNEGSSKN